MNNVWFFLIWLCVVAVEAFVFSSQKLFTATADCAPATDNRTLSEVLQFLDRIINFQSWFIPLVWLYWPTKARKRENRLRKQAFDKLRSSVINDQANDDKTDDD